MTVAFRSKSTNNAFGTGSVVVTKPAGTIDDDFLIAFCEADNTNAGNFTSSGWTELYGVIMTVDSGNVTVLYKKASSDPSSYTFTSVLGTDVLVTILAYSGVNTTTPINTWNHQDDTTAAISPYAVTAPTITTTVPNTMVIWLGCGDAQNTTAYTAINTPAGYTQREAISDSGWNVIAAAELFVASAGVVSAASATFDNTGWAGRYGFHIALAPSGPAINTQPSNQTAGAGNTATFSVSATSSGGTLTYQWYKNTVSVGGATSSSYTTPTLTGADNGNVYYCAVSDDAGTSNSNNASLVVLVVPTVTTQPIQQSAPSGGTATFTVAATASYGSLSYQWYRAPSLTNIFTNVPGSFSSISGATSASYTTGTLSSANNADWYYCAVTDSNGTTNSYSPRLFISGIGSTGNASAVGQFGSFNAWFYTIKQHRINPGILLRQQMLIESTTAAEKIVFNDMFWPSILASIRALILSSGTLTQITNADVGTGKKPIVWYGDKLQERTASEGTALVWDGTKLRLFNSTAETLIL